jgi:hypothetical protein
MPVGWLTMGTPEEFEDLLRGDPDGFEALVDRRVADAGGQTIDVLWLDENPRKAHIVVAVPTRNADQVFAALESAFGTSVTRLWNLQELKRRQMYSS